MGKIISGKWCSFYLFICAVNRGSLHRIFQRVGKAE